MSGMANWKAKIELDIKDLQKQLIDADEKIDKFANEERKVKLDIDTKTLESAIQKLDKMLDSLGKGTGDFKQFENLSKELSSIVSEVQSLSKAFGKVDDSGAKTLLSSIQNIDKSLSELSQNILNVNKNMSNMGGNTSDAVKQVENITNESKKAASALEDVAKAQAKVNGQKTNISSESKVDEVVSSAKDLDNTLNQIDIPTDSFDKVLEKLDRTKSELVDIVKITKQSVSDADGKFHDSYTLKDSRGSTEIYGMNSKTDKGQILRQNIVGYDAKKDTELIQKNKTAYEELTEAIRQYSEVSKRVSSGKAKDDDIEKMSQLEEKISQLQKQPILSDSQVAKSESALVSLYDQLDKIERKLQETNQKQVGSGFGKLFTYQSKIDKYNTTINRFKDGGWTSNTYLENVQAVKNAVKEYETLLNELKGKDANLVTSDDINRLDNYEKKIKDTIATVTNMSASEKGYNFVSGQKELDKIHKLLNENSKMSSEAKAKIKAYYAEIESGNPSMSLDKIHGEILKIYNAEVEAGRAGRTLFDTLKNSGFHQIAAQMAGMVGVYDVINGLKQVASTVIDLNTQITDLAKVSEATSSQIYDDFSSYADIAKDIGGTISDTISATADWSRNGYNLPDSKELARVALLYKNVGDGIDIDTANESLISTLRGFKMEADEAEKIIDIFNNVSNNEPIDSGGIGEALQRSAASFNAANTSLQESVALISTTNSVIQNPEKVGNMWKVVSMRIRSATSELEQAGEDTDGLVTSTADLQKMIKAMTGYDILESDGKTFKSIYDIVLNISKVWNNLSDLDQSSLLQALAGKQQSNALAAALSNPELLEKSYQEAMDSAGSAAEEEKKYQQSVQYSIDQTKAKLEELSADLLSSDFLKGAIDAGGKLIDVLDGIVKSGNAIPAVATAIAAALSFKNVG